MSKKGDDTVKRRMKMSSKIKSWFFGMIGLSLLLMSVEKVKATEVNLSGASSHIGTFEESTTFVATGSNGVNPGLFIEVMDRYGEFTQYESANGVITIPETKEGAYVTQAKLLGETKYKDKDTNEILDTWEEGRKLELVSVENPKLKIIGKNLFDGDVRYGGLSAGSGVGTPFEEAFESSSSTRAYSQLYPVNSNKVSITMKNLNQKYAVYQWDEDMNRIYGESWQTTPSRTIVLNEKTRYINLYLANQDDSPIDLSEFRAAYQIEISDFPTDYAPYQSAILKPDESVLLRGVGEVQDELDLVNGGINQRIGEVLLDGTEKWELTDGDMIGGMNYLMNSNSDVKKNVNTLKVNTISDVIPSIAFTDVWNERLEGLSTSNSNRLGFRISTAKFETAEEFKTFLTLNPLSVQYEKISYVNQTILVNTSYYFKPITDRDIYVKGKVLPLVCSVVVPTEDLTFILNPNEEEGKQFIAPTFSVVNETPASIFLELRSFTQETDVFNDVLPTKHSDWTGLNKEESKDIALALLPIPSNNWISLNEGPRYVAEDEKSLLGEVKAKSTVDFTFIASHGQAFTEMLEPVYKLVFVFDF